MPIPAKYRAPFYPGSNYHVRFRSIDGVKLFREPEDRLFYLQQFTLFFQPVSNCFAYALLDNHSHFIIQIKSLDEILQTIGSMPRQFQTKPMQALIDNPVNESIISDVVERQVNTFMAAYAKVTNKSYSRKGGLFQSPFRRSLITGDQYLLQAIIYTHANAQKHRIVEDFTKYPYTSYYEIIAGNSPYVSTGRVLEFFGGKEEFIRTHKTQIDFFYGRNRPAAILEWDQ